MSTFHDLGVPADLVDALQRANITEPFPVQVATIPDALAGTDVCGKAPTGSGKTLAFGIPLVVRVQAARPRRPRALVLAPTRELAAQIHKDLELLGASRNKRVCTVYGGVGYEKQKKALRRGVEILVACPGRLRDLMEQNAVRLDSVEIVVIDEADRMADMGFLPEVRKILDETSADRQTLLFSATLDGDVAVLQRKYQRDNAVTYSVASEADDAAIDHLFEELDPTERVARTAELVRKYGSTIVFTRTRHGAERLAKQLKAAGVDAAAIHGGLSQNKRDRALAAFKSYKAEALIATDVAARGIHVDAVACVVHFDPPVDSKTYVHRSGRTARAGATGTVVSFVARDQRAASRALRKQLGLLPESSEPTRSSRDGRDNRDGRVGRDNRGKNSGAGRGNRRRSQPERRRASTPSNR
ncbi:MAG TPA: DEAD/DEAH box helicase [Acidimicrobiia bacterium]